MSDWLFKSWLKISALTAILFFFYHLFISQKLEEESFTSNKDK
ncbi:MULTISPECIES: hypothetical protein [unclassified Fibrobacter]|jgi:hypothetical protein|nr:MULTISPECIES: hypothetical protein [unclassified Fibrobacter]SHH69075.1 hypothetical protein SAMN05720761_12232 [Fibrobacter sp. UWCM]SHN03199.1 hypothetical protein SAMN05720472_0076 [Fibrobacter sp. UWR3]SOE55563.1 hypothetical protein SAMN05720781_0949 [Fibrobacter sp. UWT3]